MIRWCLALALDLVTGEPPSRVHPVVAMGRLITWLEQRAPATPRAQLAHGVLIAAVPALGSALLARSLERVPNRVVRALLSAWVLKTAFSLHALLDASIQVEAALEGDHVDRARDALRSLVSRERASLDRAHVASAAIESTAENLSDSYVAPLFWYVVGGLPAALAYRAINTADAMVGYRGHYEFLGKASARLDDLVNYLPSRITAIALITAAPLVGLSATRAAAAMCRDGGRTASPNAGWPMAAAAGALQVWLEKPGHYRLGAGRVPAAHDIRAARRLAFAAAGVVTVVTAMVWRRW